MARITVAQLQARIAELEQQVAERDARIAGLVQAAFHQAVVRANSVVIERHGQRVTKRYPARSAA